MRAILLKRIGRKIPAKLKRNSQKKEKSKRFEALLHVLEHYCMNTTLHGLRYVADSKLHPLERFLWLLLFAVSTVIAQHVIYMLASKYQAAPTLISIDTMHYKVSGIPFPSVTLCPDDRVDWDKTMELEKRLFPNSTDPDTLQTFRDLISTLSSVSFGDFDELVFLRDRRLENLLHLNITEILREVAPSCDSLFSECWWRNSYYNCCEVLELQKTEYGFCYSFNSEMSEMVHERGTLIPQRRHMKERPLKASGYGDWTGIHVIIHLGNITRPPSSDQMGNLVLMLHDPRVWPNSGMRLAMGTLSLVSLDCIAGYATQSVIDLDKKKRPCKHLPTVAYNQETCLSFCKQRHVYKACGCSPFHFFPARMTDCNITDIFCLVENNDLFNDYFVTDVDDGTFKNTMVCDCPPECEYYMYMPQYTAVPLGETKDIMLDVHFAGQTCFRYKTDIVFTNLDLLVSFGGIIGLFLGGSLLSAAELIYYLMAAVFSYVRGCCDLRRRGRGRLAPRKIPGAIPALPILDYGPVKPRSTRIPILPNYASVKSNLDRY